MTGQGVIGRIEGRAVALGNQHMMREFSVAIDAISPGHLGQIVVCP